MHRALSVGLLAALLAPAAMAQGPHAPPDTAPGGFKKFDDVVQGAVHRPGYFDTYEKGDNLYLLIPVDRLGTDFLMESKIARGVGAHWLFGGQMLNVFEPSIVAFERHGNRIFLVQEPHRFDAETDATRRALALTFSPSVLDAAPIEAIRADSAILINVHDWFVSDLSGVSQAVRSAVGGPMGRPGQASFEKSKSHLEAVKGFPRNVNVRARLTFRPGEPVDWASVPDGRYISFSLHYTLAALPDDPMTPRLADDRVGSFLTVRKDFSQEDSSAFVRYVNRWRLEPGERVGDLVRPVRPITYYIDPNVPEEYRPALRAGVEAWNHAFEAAGWKDAIRVEPLPDGADAEDVRYATLRWNVSDLPSYGAIGPSLVDPRTGEILDADILFEAALFLNFRNAWRTLVQPASAADAFLAALEPVAAPAGAPGTELAGFASALALQGGFLQAALTARGEIAPGTPVPDAYVFEVAKWVTMHEVGHTLGLRHNFRSSASTPVARLHDAEWTERNGVASSVMEYPTPNVTRGNRPVGHYYNTSVGSYDRWAISYAYTPDDGRARALAREVADPAHLYGTDNEVVGPGALDPTINLYDLSADPLAWARDRTALIHDLVASLPRYVLTDNGRYNEVTVALQALLGMYGQALVPAVKTIGGQYLNRDHVGDPNGRPPFANVPRARQREALALLVDRVFAERALAVPRDVLQRLGSNRWLQDWNTKLTWEGRLDFPYHEQTLALQRAVLAQVLHPFRLARIRDAETKFGAGEVLTIPELMDGLTEAIWGEVWTAPGHNVNALRRDLQRAYLDRFTELVATPPDRLPADARAVARVELQSLDRRLARRLTPPANFDAYTTAHLRESRARIAKALEAGLEVEQEHARAKSSFRGATAAP